MKRVLKSTEFWDT